MIEANHSIRRKIGSKKFFKHSIDGNNSGIKCNHGGGNMQVQWSQAINKQFKNAVVEERRVNLYNLRKTLSTKERRIVKSTMTEHHEVS